VFDWIRQNKRRAARDRIEVDYILKMHGRGAVELLRSRATAEDLDHRTRRHWARIGRLVERQLKE